MWIGRKQQKRKIVKPPNKAVFALYKIKALDIRKEVCYCVRVHTIISSLKAKCLAHIYK